MKNRAANILLQVVGIKPVRPHKVVLGHNEYE